jgi:hypothetical protein
VTDTSAQPWQLNLDLDSNADKDSDVTVWYTLDNGSAVTGANGENFNSAYHASPFDARNNYYIYNRGSVTCSGFGRGIAAGNPKEMQLFINTLVAACSSGIRKPSVTIYADTQYEKEKERDVLPYDPQVFRESEKESVYKTDMQDAYYFVYFRPVDFNASDVEHQIDAEFYAGFGSDTTYDGSFARARTLSSYTSDFRLLQWNGTEWYNHDPDEKLESGGYYALKVPLYDLIRQGTFQADDTMDIFISAKVRQGSGETAFESAVGFDKISLSHQQLFDLD